MNDHGTDAGADKFNTGLDARCRGGRRRCACRRRGSGFGAGSLGAARRRRCRGGSCRAGCLHIGRLGRRSAARQQFVGKDENLKPVARRTNFKRHMGTWRQRHIGSNAHRAFVGGDGGEAVAFAPEHDALDDRAGIDLTKTARWIGNGSQHRGRRHRPRRSDEAATQRVEDVAHVRLMSGIRPASASTSCAAVVPGCRVSNGA